MKIIKTSVLLVLLAFAISACRTPSLKSLPTLSNVLRDAETLGGTGAMQYPKNMTIANGTTNYNVRIDSDGFNSAGGISESNVLQGIRNVLRPLHGPIPIFALIPFDPITPTMVASNLTTMMALLDVVDQLKALPIGAGLRMNLASNIHDLLEDQLSQVAVNQNTNVTLKVSLEGLAAAYLKAYLDGTFVDRWGVPLSQPDITKSGNDTTIAYTKVLLEALFDYSFMTPIVHDSNPSNTNKTPTFAVIFPALYEKISTDPKARGITSAEWEAIHYLSGLSAEQAKHLSALIIKTIGGADFGLKISTGDNDVLAQIISELCEEIARRAAENWSYSMFEQFQYIPTNAPLGYVPDTSNNLAKMPELTLPVQEVMLAFLVTQDNLKALLKGGWKLSRNNITNYEALAARLGAGTNKAPLFNLLPLSVQNILTNKSSLGTDQQQALVDALNQIMQTNQSMLKPELLQGISLSAATTNLMQQNPQGSDLARLNYLLMLDIINSSRASD